MNARTTLDKLRLLYRLWTAWRQTDISLGQLFDLTGIQFMVDRDDDEILQILIKGMKVHSEGGPESNDKAAYDLHALGWRAKEEYLPVRRLLYLGDWASVVSEELWSKIILIQKSHAWDDWLTSTDENGDIEYDA